MKDKSVVKELIELPKTILRDRAGAVTQMLAVWNHLKAMWVVLPENTVFHEAMKNHTEEGFCWQGYYLALSIGLYIL